MNSAFASDNTSGVHPFVMESLLKANEGFCKPYGLDDYCQESETYFRKVFGQDIEIFFALSGTGANVLALRSLLRPWHGVICTDVAHINTEECGAPEACTGSKMLAVPSSNGKLTPSAMQHFLIDGNNVHHAKPTVVSLSQTTEQGTVYTVEEVRNLCKCAHDNNLLVHMDGARVANAAAALNVDIKAFTKEAGVDVLSFGGTKNGLMMGEAVIYFNRELVSDFYQMRKQSLQHLSKMRYVAAQFIAYFQNDLWLKNAYHANSMAQYLSQRLSEVLALTISRTTEANAVFAIMPPKLIADLMEEYYYYVVTPEINEVRFMCSFATTKEDIDILVQRIKVLSENL